MSQFGESVTGPAFPDNHDADCYFCTKHVVPVSRNNKIKQNFDEDSAIGYVEKGVMHNNNSGELGKKLGNPPDELWITEDRWEWETLVQFAAHHLIPGDGSLRPSKLYNEKICGLKEGQEEGHIGYNVNNAANGVWLPGNYAFKGEWGRKGKKFGLKYDIEPAEYVGSAIEFSGAQFHDAHKLYNNKVRDKLNEIHGKIETLKDLWCPEARDAAKTQKKSQPLYTLVNRLASLSLQLRRRLVLPTDSWRKDLYTSSFGLQWMEEQTTNRPDRKSS